MEEGAGKSFFVRESTGLTKELSAKDALIGNLTSMGLTYIFVYAFFSSLLFPGVNLPLTVLVGIVPGIVVSLLYSLFSAAMPRTGGDFVWVSRVIHPAAGFVGNFMLTFALLSYAVTSAVWAVTYTLSPMFASLGIIYSDSNLMSLAASLSSPPTSFIVAAVIFSLATLPLLFSIRRTYRVLLVLVVLSAIGTLALVGSFLSAPNSTFVSNFNRLSGMDYAKTINMAGLGTGFTISATLLGAVFTVTNFTNFNNSAYFSSEIKRVSKSQIPSMIGAVLIFGALAGLVYYSAYYSIGSDFLNAASSLSGSGNSAYTLPSPPILNFLVVFASPTPLVVFLSALAFMATNIANITVLGFVVVRNVFAWSFDRITPSWLTNLDKRGSPYLTVSLIWVIGLVLVGLFVYTIFAQFLVYLIVISFLIWVFASVAAIFLPYRRKDIFAIAPTMVQRKVGGVPAITLLGVLGVVLSIFLIYATIQPAVTPLPTGPPLVQALAYVLVPFAAIIALIIYAIAYIYHKRKGIDMRLGFKELPPE